MLPSVSAATVLSRVGGQVTESILNIESPIVALIAQLVTDLLGSCYDSAAISAGAKLLDTALACGPAQTARLLRYNMDKAAAATLQSLPLLLVGDANADDTQELLRAIWQEHFSNDTPQAVSVMTHRTSARAVKPLAEATQKHPNGAKVSTIYDREQCA